MCLFLIEKDLLLMINNEAKKQREGREGDDACICARTDKRRMEKKRE
jgi:hypothetical protein